MGKLTGIMKLGMVRKLVLVNLLVFLVFGVIVLAMLFVFRNMEGLSKTLIDDNINRVIANEQLGRDLNKVLADTDIVVGTFLHGEKDVRKEGNRIVSACAALEAKSSNPQVRERVRNLTGILRSLFEACGVMKDYSEKLEARERKMNRTLTALEGTLSEKLVSQVLEKKDASIIEQLSMVTPGYRETLLEISLEHVKLGLHRPGQGNKEQNKRLLALLDDLHLRLRTLTASEPAIASYGTRLMEDVNSCKRDTLLFFQSVTDLGQRLEKVDSAKIGIMGDMKTIDAQVSRTSADLLRRLTAVMGSSGNFIVSIAVAIISILGAFTVYFIMTNIRRPMLLIRQGIESIREGNLCTMIRLNRHDEWSDIEHALNEMVTELRTSYDDLKRMNSELGIARSELQGKVLELEDQINERERAEQELKNSEAKWHSLYNNLPGGSFTVNQDYIIEDVNDVLCTITGYAREELIGQRCGIICPKGPHNCPIFDLGRERIDNDETDVKGKDGRLVPIIKSARRIPAVGRDVIVENFQDITDRKHLEEQLQQARKMEAVGQLAGGVAHDFNNILTAIIGYGTLLQMKIDSGNPMRGNVEQILSAAERAADLTRSLLTLGRKRVIDLQPLRINDCVSGMEGLLSRLIREDIEFHTQLPPDTITVLGDKSQLEQILINLVTNACDSMPDGGKAVLNLELIEIDDAFVDSHGFGEPGRYALITVSDTGIGMDDKTRGRIFEPFYTTKEMGKGTGLGLAIVYGVVQQHGGYIEVSSEVSEGSVFRVYLPEIDVEPVEKLHHEEAVLLEGSETVLLAEDEEAVRSLIRSVLEKFGYTVLEAENGEDALEKYFEHRDRIDLLILDVIMPKINGRDAYNRIREMSPGIRTLFMSGYTGDILNSKGIMEEGLNFIPKPVAPRRLLAKVRTVLDME